MVMVKGAAIEVDERAVAVLEHDLAELNGLNGARTVHGVLRLNALGRVTFASCHLANLLGWAPEELPGQDVHVLMHPRGDPLHGTEHDTVACVRERINVGLERRGDDHVRLAARNGRPVPAIVSRVIEIHDTVDGARVLHAAYHLRLRVRADAATFADAEIAMASGYLPAGNMALDTVAS